MCVRKTRTSAPRDICSLRPWCKLTVLTLQSQPQKPEPQIKTQEEIKRQSYSPKNVDVVQESCPTFEPDIKVTDATTFHFSIIWVLLSAGVYIPHLFSPKPFRKKSIAPEEDMFCGPLFIWSYIEEDSLSLCWPFIKHHVNMTNIQAK